MVDISFANYLYSICFHTAFHSFGCNILLVFTCYDCGCVEQISQPQVSSDDQLKARRQPQKEPVIYEANIPRKPIILDIDHGVVCSQPLNAMSGTNPPGVDSAKRGGETDNVDGGRAKRKSKGDHIYYHARLVSRKEQGMRGLGPVNCMPALALRK